MANERYPATDIPKKIAEDGAPVLDAKIEVHPGQVTRLEPPAPPDVRAGTAPKPEGSSLDESYGGRGEVKR